MEIVQLLNQYGPTVGFIAGFLIILWRVLSYCANRLFAEHTGIVTKIAEKHMDFMDNIAEMQTEQNLSLIEVKKSIAELVLIYQDKHSNLSNQKIHACGLVACDVLDDISDEIEEESLRSKVKDNLRKIRTILSGQ